LQRDGQLALAVESYERAVAASHDRLPASHNNLGIIYARWHRYDEAAREFDRALQLSKGTFAEARYNLSLCERLRTAAHSALLAQLKISEADTSATVQSR
jgi:tetratricopeptide (TPR) repeat protein